jgi:hypothetical protein
MARESIGRANRAAALEWVRAAASELLGVPRHKVPLDLQSARSKHRVMWDGQPIPSSTPLSETELLQALSTAAAILRACRKTTQDDD